MPIDISVVDERILITESGHRLHTLQAEDINDYYFNQYDELEVITLHNKIIIRIADLRISGAGSPPASTSSALTTLDTLFPDAGVSGGTSTPTAIAFSEEIPFDIDYSLMNHTVVGAINFEPDETNRITGGSTYVRLVANGINEPTFDDAFTQRSGSYLNVAGTVHRIIFFWNGYEYEVSIAQLNTVEALPLLFATNSNVSEVLGDWTGSGGTWIAAGLDAKKLASNKNGWIEITRIATTDQSILAFRTTNSLAFGTTYLFQTFIAGIYFDGPTLYGINNGALSAGLGTIANGTRLRINVSGSVMKLQSSTDDWATATDKYTYPQARVTDLYVLFNINGAVSGVLTQPKGYNLV